MGHPLWTLLSNGWQIETAMLSMYAHGQCSLLRNACQTSLPIKRGQILKLPFEILTVKNTYQKYAPEYNERDFHNRAFLPVLVSVLSALPRF